ncbi:hypothetical protein LIER_15992 [Lithospermum erythrorhizon]|uniref:Reverse transcriptase RNase H-like domain-containing protein n=1 Tax=Lithospermum erythrorhizon TaxID=34254 RepID=A0AAV3Q6F2_LITER
MPSRHYQSREISMSLKACKENWHTCVGTSQTWQASANPSGKPLRLYVASQEQSVWALLAQENEEEKENALYYLSGRMTPNELNYSTIEKLCLALVFAIQKLKHYFQADIVHLIS